MRWADVYYRHDVVRDSRTVNFSGKPSLIRGRTWTRCCPTALLVLDIRWFVQTFGWMAVGAVEGRLSFKQDGFVVLQTVYSPSVEPVRHISHHPAYPRTGSAVFLPSRWTRQVAVSVNAVVPAWCRNMPSVPCSAPITTIASVEPFFFWLPCLCAFVLRSAARRTRLAPRCYINCYIMTPQRSYFTHAGRGVAFTLPPRTPRHFAAGRAGTFSPLHSYNGCVANTPSALDGTVGMSSPRILPYSLLPACIKFCWTVGFFGFLRLIYAGFSYYTTTFTTIPLIHAVRDKRRQYVSTDTARAHLPRTYATFDAPDYYAIPPLVDFMAIL